MNPGTCNKRAVFLDRDGTINEENGYLRRLEDLDLIAGASEGIRLLNSLGLSVIVTSNQSGVARGYFNETFVSELHAEIDRRLAREGARIDAWYYCPHHPTEGSEAYRKVCACRKPAPGMVDRARLDLGIDPADSYVVGDSPRDAALAWAVDAKAVLVLTGYGRQTLAHLREIKKDACVRVEPDLLAACRWIAEDMGRKGFHESDM